MEYAEIMRKVEEGQVAIFDGVVLPDKTTTGEIEKLPVYFARNLSEAIAACKEVHREELSLSGVAHTEFTLYDGEKWRHMSRENAFMAYAEIMQKVKNGKFAVFYHTHGQKDTESESGRAELVRDFAFFARNREEADRRCREFQKPRGRVFEGSITDFTTYDGKAWIIYPSDPFSD